MPSLPSLCSCQYSNKKIHNISFDEAQYTFLDSKRIIYKDIKHSIYEERFFCIGKIENGIATVRRSF
jgi:uncharacterized DUF497 family protein